METATNLDFDFSADFWAEINGTETDEQKAVRFEREKAEAIVAEIAAVEYKKAESKKCPKCNGSGKIDCYKHVSLGVCFRCNGSGKK